jgi:hypothetical protein
VHPGPVSGSGRDEDPARPACAPDNFPEDGCDGWRLVPSRADWVDEPGYLAALAEDEEPSDPDLWEDPDNAPPPDLDDAQLAALIAEAREVSADQARAEARAARLGTTGGLAVIAAANGRRGPGMPGSARRFPGEYSGPASGFGSGRELDTAAGCPLLPLFADEAAGQDDRYAGASDDELLGAIAAWDRAEAHMAARKHAAVAELIRRRPEPGGRPRLPSERDEFVAVELSAVLGMSRRAAEDVLGLAWALDVMLPGTKAAFRAGIVGRYKAGIIAAATALLDPAEARAAEALVLGRAGTLTPGGLQAAIARAVMEVAPGKARKRREAAARDARVERWAEASGNASLAGRELPPAQVFAADQRVTWWAEQLKQAGVDGSMDQLRARAFLDIMLGLDSRPDQAATGPTNHAAQPGPGGNTGSNSGSNSGPGGTDGRRDVDDGCGHGPNGPGPSDTCASGPSDPPAPGPSDRPGPGLSDRPGPGLSDRPGPGLSGPSAGGPLFGVVPPGFAGRVNLTIPLATLLGLADRPGEIAGIGPIDPALVRDLAAAAARTPRSTWCVTVTDQDGHAIGHGCARPEPRHPSADRTKPNKPGKPGGHDPPLEAGSTNRLGFTFTAEDQHGPPGGYGTWRLSTGTGGQSDLIVALGLLPAGGCDHRYQASGHDPGVLLRHLAQVRHATCTGPACRRPAARCDFEHDIPYEAGGRTCLCNGDPKCRYDHRLKQDPRWKVDLLAGGNVRWTMPSGRQHITEPTRYPI